MKAKIYPDDYKNLKHTIAEYRKDTVNVKDAAKVELNKAKAISAKLFELNLNVQLCNLVTV